MEDFDVPRTHSPEPFQLDDYVTPSSSSISATATTTSKATGSIARRTNASITNTYPPKPVATSTQQLNHLQEDADTSKPSVPVSTVPAIPPPRYWHPKLTVYRLLVIITTLGFGISKAVLSYQGRTIVPITLEWFFGMGVFLLLYWLGLYEYNPIGSMPYLFTTDYSSDIKGPISLPPFFTH
ncbi:hypothetical protein BDQ17DRAFT_1301608 [Cyathus striatus]|nr:hypothetical protein BDQ17DRAFT_1301608 [Cyathus striatus]